MIWKAKAVVGVSLSSGVTCLGLREGHDNTNVGDMDGLNDQVTVSMSEQTGTSQDPYLDITYTAPSVAMKLPIKGGTLNVSGGKLKISSF